MVNPGSVHTYNPCYDLIPQTFSNIMVSVLINYNLIWIYGLILRYYETVDCFKAS